MMAQRTNPISLPDQAVYFGGKRYWRRVWDVRKSKDGQISGAVKFAGKDWRVYQVGGPDGHWDTNRVNPAKRYYKGIDAGGREVYYLDSRKAGRLIRVSPDEAELAKSTGQGTIGHYDFKTKRFNENPWPFSRPDARRTTPASGGIAYHTRRKRADEGNAEFLKSVKSKAPKSKKAAGVSAMPDEATLQAGFKRGLSLREILGNPAPDESVQDKSWREWQENFNRVTRDPERATAKDLRRALGYLDKARGSFIRRAHEKGLKPDGNVLAGFDNEYEYLKSLMFKRERGNPGLFSDLRDDLFGPPVNHAAKDWAALKRDERAPKKRKGKRNPATASAEAFEEFHGFAPSEVITVTKKIHYHKHLAAAGKLTHLDVWGVDEAGHKISGFKGAFLAFNEQKNQLFVEGGDQSVNLEDFGIDSPHELETLGRLTDIGYQTNKTHLGDEGGEAVYVHKFRSTNENGKHVIVRIARYPDLIYDVRNEQLLFSGGSYEILREGIDK